MPVDARVQNFTAITNEPTSDDSIVVVNRNNNAGQIIDYNLLADKILAKMASKTFSGLTTSAKAVIGAINELDADTDALNTKFNNIKQTFAAVANTTTTLEFSNSVGTRRLLVLGHQSEPDLNGIYFLMNNAVFAIVPAPKLTVTTNGTSVTIVSTSTRNANGFII